MREWIKAMNGEDYDYRKMVKSRVVLGKVYMLLGVLEILVMCMTVQMPGESAGDFYLASGIAIVACGFLIMRKNRRLLSFEQEMSKMEIREKDERFRRIGTRSWAMAGYVMMIGLYAAVLILMAVGQQTARVLVLVMLAFWILVLGFQIYFRKTM